MGFLKILSKGNIFLVASVYRLRLLLVYRPWTTIWALFFMTHFIVVGAKTPATKLAIVRFFTWKIKEIIRWVLIPIKSGFLGRIFFQLLIKSFWYFLMLKACCHTQQDGNTKPQTIYVSFRQRCVFFIKIGSNGCFFYHYYWTIWPHFGILKVKGLFIAIKEAFSEESSRK